ncbi:hypothetical protein [Geminisphaera colitermitum]|uniref:hypothetical protein n=1 Tax=Geminisphaera colitermitum TaxID=1148786 RepID=UPI00019655E6|nr:hypothetical protein [Geminisphaera colitermitum]
MKPFEEAALVYGREPCARLFEDDLALHFRHGYVFNAPDYFVMGRSVPRCALHLQIVDPNYSWPDCVCDCWHLYLFAGDMRAALSMFPYPLPWASFERNNKLRFYPFDRLNQLISKL